MKKVLILTTALVATGSVAAADVRFSGYGRFGLDYNDSNDTATNGLRQTNLTSRLRLQVDMSTETDGGVGFNARFRAQADSRNNSSGTLVTDSAGDTFTVPGGANFNGARFGVTYGGMTVNVGNIIGAVENTPGLYLPTTSAGTGVNGAGFASLVLNSNGQAFGWDAYSSSGAGANGVEVLYTAGGFTGHISYSQGNVGCTIGCGAAVTGRGNANFDRTRLGIMAAYTFGDWTIAASHQNANNSTYNGVTAPAIADSLTMVAVTGNIGAWGLGLAAGDNDGAMKYRLYASYDVGSAGTILGWVSQENSYDVGDGQMPDANSDGTGYGINYEYDLGGGVTLIAGYANYPTPGQVDVSRAQTGVRFNF